jgi:hypothetical protein
LSSFFAEHSDIGEGITRFPKTTPKTRVSYSETYSEVISLPLLAGSVNGLRVMTPWPSPNVFARELGFSIPTRGLGKI